MHQLFGQGLEYLGRDPHPPLAEPGEDGLDGGLHRPRSRLVGALSLDRQKQMRTPSVGGVRPPFDQTLTFEAQQDARERAGVQTQQVRQFPGSDAGKSSDQAQPKPLRPGEPQTAGHVLCSLNVQRTFKKIAKVRKNPDEWS